MQQRHIQWEWKQKFLQIQSECEALYDGKSGMAINVARYSCDPIPGANSSDVGRANRTLEFCSGKEEKSIQYLRGTRMRGRISLMVR